MMFSGRPSEGFTHDRDWLELCQVPEPAATLPPTLQFNEIARFLALLDADAA